MARPAHLHGFLNIDKPLGITSTDVVRRVRRLARQSQVGHGGTLDPLATGVLPIALGNATRLLEYLLEEETKRYVATIRLGAMTTTDDAEGEVVSTAAVPQLTAELLADVLAQFRGTFEQIPPIYAAIRVAGRRLYEYARSGEAVEVPARSVTVFELTLLEQHAETLIIDVLCSKGTYIRALARDIGAALGCGAYLTALRRTQTGPFFLDTAVTLEALETPDALEAALLPAVAALRDWEHVVVDEPQVKRLRQGQRITRASDAPRAAAIDATGTLIAILQAADNQWQPTKVVGP